MKTEMDMLKMDERQRLCWLLANRATLIIVGVLWLALIVRELMMNHRPYELIVAVPLIAAVRLVLYKYYARREIPG
ncbi:hypothetical protein ACFLQW_00050 [Candidatus Zixiibacteriota bacterium]